MTRLVTRIVVVRHGHVDGIDPPRFRGCAEFPLSELGRRQAEALGRRVARGWQPDAIYTSNLSRCIDTGTAIERATGAPASVLGELADIDYGQWQGLTHDRVESLWPGPARMWFSKPDMALIPGGETLAQVLVRVMSVLHFVLLKHAGQTVVLVGHDSVNRALLLHCLGLSLSHYWQLRQTPCCVNECTFEDDSFVIQRINETGHLIGV